VSTIVIAYGEAASTIETELLQNAGYSVAYVDSLVDPDDPRLGDAVAVMVTVQPVTAEMLDRMPRCRVVGRVGTGVDAIDVEAATDRGVYVTNVPDYSVDEVSTHAIALLLAHARRLPQYFALVERGAWDSVGAGPIRRLAGLTLGVLGFGRIGQAATRKALGLGMTVVVADSYQSPDSIRAVGAEPVEWPDLLRRSDYVSLHVPLTDQTWHILDAPALAAMKTGAVVINTARGALIDESALADAVRSGAVGGALLDVLSQEPPPADHPLLGTDGIWITPHTGWYSLQAQQDVAQRAAEDVRRVLAGEMPRSPVNQPAPRGAEEAAKETAA
jgi:D-3-phosphoglycerate dehydrogenase / 2-oxoglutarate reductase